MKTARRRGSRAQATEEWLNRWLKNGFIFCFYCDRLLGETKKGIPGAYGIFGARATVDHVTPVSRNGANEYANLVPCCPECNTAKADMTLEEFRETPYFREHGRGEAAEAEFPPRVFLVTRKRRDGTTKTWAVLFDPRTRWPFRDTVDHRDLAFESAP